MRNAMVRAILYVVLPYALVAGVWGLLSDLLLTDQVAAPAARIVIQSLNDLLFVAATTLLLTGLLYRELRDRQASAATLSQSQRLAAQLADALPGLLYIFHLDRQENAYVNHGLEYTLGYQPHEVTALGPNWVSQLVHPDDMQVYVQDMLPRYASLAPGEALENTFRMRPAAGGWRWFRSRDLVFERDAAGRPTQILGIALDITEQREAEMALRENERRLRALAQASPVGLFQSNAAGDCIYVNDGWSQITGYPAAEALGKSWLAALPAEFRAEAQAVWQTATDTSAPTEWVVQLERPDGQRVWVLGRAQPIFNAGVFQGHVGTLTDISAQKTAEARAARFAQVYALLTEVNQTLMRARERQPMFTAVCQSAAAHLQLPFTWIGLVDGAGRVVVAASAGAGAAYREILDQQLTADPRGPHPAAVAAREARSVIYPSLAPAAAEPWAAAALAHGQRALAILPLMVFGQVRGVLGLHAAEPDLAGGEEQGLLETLAHDLAQAMEIIEQDAQRRHLEIVARQSESRFRTFFEKAPFYCFMVAPDGLTLDVNPAALHALGYAYADLIGAPLLPLYAPASRDQVRLILDRWAAAGDPGPSEVRVQTQAGAERVAELHLAAVDSPAGPPLYYIFIHRDITAAVQAETALRESEARYRLLVDQAPIALVISQDRRIVFANPEAARLVGFARPEALAGRSLQELPLADETAEAGADNEPAPVRHYRRPDGSLIDVELNIAPIHFQGRPAQQVLARDVTARRRAELELRRSTERLRNLREIDHAIIQAASPADIATAALMRIRRLVPCQRASMNIFDLAANQGEVFALADDHATSAGIGHRWPLHPQHLAQLRGGAPVLVEDIAALADQSPTLRALAAEGIRTYLNIPLVVHGELLGSLNLGAATPHAFTPEYVEIASEVGAQLAVIFTNARLLETTLRQSAELRASEARYRHLVERLPAIVYRFSDKRGGVYYSPHTEILLGWSPEELYAQPMLWHDAIDPAALSNIDAAIQAFQAGVAFDLEYRIRRQDGQWRWLRDQSIARVVEGDETFIEGLAVDITARRQAEEALRQNEQRLRVALAALDVAVFEQDPDLRYTWMYQPQLGYATEEILGRTDLDLLPAEAAAATRALKQQALETGARVRGVVAVAGPAETRYFDMVVEPMQDAAGRCRGITGSSTDATLWHQQAAALRASELRYRALFEEAGDGIFIADQQGQYLDVNTRGCLMLGYTRAEILAHNMADLSDETGLALTPAQFAELAAGRPLVLERRLRRANGAWLETEITSQLLPDGRLQGIVRDITARKQAEAALQTQFTRLNALYAQAHRFTESLDPFQVAQSVTRQCVETFGAQLAWLGEAEPDGRLKILAHFPPDIDYPHQVQVRWDETPEGAGPTGQAIRTGVPVLSHEFDPALLAAWRELIQQQHFQASAAFPLISREQAFGALNLYSAQPAFFSAELVALFEAFAHQAAAALANARLYQTAAEHSQQLRGLAMRLAEVEEAERRALARELHDRVGANLTALNLSLTLVNQQLPAEAKPQLGPRLDDASHLLQETMAQVRDVMMDLRPSILDDYGLLAALRWHAERLAQRTGLAVSVAGAEPEPRLAPNVETTLFRVAQEALTNVVKHARARQAQVTLTTAGPRVALAIADDGVGFTPGPAGLERGGAGWGMIHMRERLEALGGRLEVKTAPAAGTALFVELTR